MKITYLPRTIGACDLYRVTQPLQWVGRHMKEHQIHELNSNALRAAVENDDAKTLMKLLSSDVVVVPRLWGYKAFQDLKDLVPKAKIVLEYDDNLFNVSPLSPHYEDHGVEEVTMSLPGGGTAKVWQDGVNFNLSKNRKHYDETIRAMEEADLITTTTEILAGAFREYNKNVVALPNCVDLSLWRRLPLRPRLGDIRMGWFGGSSHYEDWTLLEEVLPAVMRKYPQLKLVIMGQIFQGTIKNLPADRVEHHHWVPTDAYPYKAAILDLDFGIIPLRNTTFNICKSPIKWCELGALQVPTVASYVSPYKEVATEENGVWVENDPAAWIEGISLMVEDQSQRLDMAAEAYKTVCKDFAISKKYQMWPQAYEGVLNGKPNAAHLIGTR